LGSACTPALIWDFTAPRRLVSLIPADAEPELFAGVLMAADWMASGFAFEPGERRALAEVHTAPLLI
jgi:hypothetical protein